VLIHHCAAECDSRNPGGKVFLCGDQLGAHMKVETLHVGLEGSTYFVRTVKTS